MSRRLLVFILALFVSISAYSEDADGRFEYWWPVCIFDGTGGGSGLNAAITEMVKMAAQCQVNLDVRPFSIPPGAEGGDVEKFKADAKAKCNLTEGFQSRGVNRASILAVLGNTWSAQQMCSAMGARDRAFCGELSFDPGEAQRFRMANTGYYGGYAKPGEPALSIVSGNAINARDMSAVALGQGMMALPQGFGAGNGVGGLKEGQAAGGSNVDSGWSQMGCDRMRAAAFPNKYRSMKYMPEFKDWYPTDGKIRYIDDITNRATPLFGPGPLMSKAPAMESASTKKEVISPAESVFRKSTASVPSSNPSGHPRQSDGQVTSIRDREEVASAPDAVAINIPPKETGTPGSRIGFDEGAKVSDDLMKELGAKPGTQSGAPSAASSGNSSAQAGGAAALLQSAIGPSKPGTSTSGALSSVTNPSTVPDTMGGITPSGFPKTSAASGPGIKGTPGSGASPSAAQTKKKTSNFNEDFFSKQTVESPEESTGRGRRPASDPYATSPETSGITRIGRD